MTSPVLQASLGRSTGLSRHQQRAFGKGLLITLLCVVLGFDPSQLVFAMAGAVMYLLMQLGTVDMSRHGRRPASVDNRSPWRGSSADPAIAGVEATTVPAAVADMSLDPSKAPMAAS
eukprot:TRINITY_DN44936_c0_g1_i1.p2 TRINITY_DN44936_c0_g1~~TRINITY_DN44936_c0_g1_i1.p2  ORF type:complete len:117 (-),score=21.60 TRINITY_DN44936_c0_g1_i1:263-613(-)